MNYTFINTLNKLFISHLLVFFVFVIVIISTFCFAAFLYINIVLYLIFCFVGQVFPYHSFKDQHFLLFSYLVFRVNKKKLSF